MDLIEENKSMNWIQFINGSRMYFSKRRKQESKLESMGVSYISTDGLFCSRDDSLEKNK